MYVDGYTEGETDTYSERNGYSYIPKMHMNMIDRKQVAHTMVGLVCVTPVGLVHDLEVTGDSTDLKQNYFSENHHLIGRGPPPSK